MKRSIQFILIICVLAAGSAFGAIPKQINYQGALAGSGGTPLANTTVSVEFRIYDAPAGGSSKWVETQSVTTDGQGLFKVVLGLVTPIEDTVFKETERYLSVNVASNGEIVPRTKLVSVGYSNRVSTVDGAKGGTVNGYIFVTDNLYLQNNAGGNANNVLSIHGYSDNLDIDAISSFGSVVGTSVRFWTAPAGLGHALRMIVLPNGNVGIGNGAPANPLDMGSGAHCTAGGVWTNASSREYKTDIVPLQQEEYSEILEKLEKMDVVHFKYKTEPDVEHIGMIAEDVPQEIASPDRKGIPTADAIAFLVAAVKAQQTKIEKLENKLEQLTKEK